ncbi:hypothetical protein V1517DRAFT_341434 [Lipomyces orientalis]|uniref:Uncharacterized protein n=1 Tax=Lipomyces orientalis TaxID=1233043 RepID=A0ACC3TFS6_9ASCO
MRMTGCPNGCVRPYLAEVAMVGKAYGVYNIMLGGGYSGSSVNEEQALALLKPLFKRWALERGEGEHFGFLIRELALLSLYWMGANFMTNVAEGDEE